MLRLFATTLLLAAAAAPLRAQSAPARTPARAETVRVVNHFTGSEDPADEAALSELFQSLQTLGRYQQRFYAEHGRFAVTGEEIPEFRPMPNATIFVTSGGDWIVLNGQLEGKGSGYSITLWVKDTPQRILSGSFSAPPAGTR